MRKACFAFVLVIAAFTGGAVMNGPGLEWLKVAIRARMASIDTTPRRTEVPIRDPALPPRDVPAAPLPPLSLAGTAEPAATSETKPTEERKTEAASTAIPINAPAPKSEVAPLELAAPEVQPAEAPRVADAAVAPASQAVPGAHNSFNPRDWNELRRRMRELGVSRYEVEGAPGGKSRFRCLIPLAGRRAVGQQFEGEGEDDFQAAEAALRRLSLWKATEMSPQ